MDWQYRVLTAKGGNETAESDMLDTYGRMGWELVTVIEEADGTHRHYFKKPS